jgi:VWFA-related protein
MNCFKLSGLLHGFFERRQAGLLAGLLFVAVGLTAQAQTSATNPRPVRLHVVAVDSAGQPVPDLTASELAVSDNGSPQQIVSVRLNHSDRPRPVVILFDLLNASETSRGAVWNAIRTPLAHVQSTGPLFLYVLAPDGSLYPVHAMPAAPAAQGVADASWPKDIGAVLDAAMEKVNQVKPLEFRAVSPTSLQERFRVTYNALENMRAQMAVLRGSKELLWITYGIPSTIQFVDHTWFYGAPFLQKLGARFVQSETTVYTADPGINLERGMLDRDSLDILTGATGGHAFSTIDLDRAISQIEADGRANYSVEYRPPANNWDGKYHKLRVTVARKGVRLQAEHGYYAVSGS